MRKRKTRFRRDRPGRNTLGQENTGRPSAGQAGNSGGGARDKPFHPFEVLHFAAGSLSSPFCLPPESRRRPHVKLPFTTKMLQDWGGAVTFRDGRTLFERGLVTSKGIVTHDFPLDNWAEAFDLANSVKSIKVLLKPGQ